jgi:hypothetical protein
MEFFIQFNSMHFYVLIILSQASGHRPNHIHSGQELTSYLQTYKHTYPLIYTIKTPFITACTVFSIYCIVDHTTSTKGKKK